MDLTVIEASAGTALITLSGAAIYIKKYGPKAYRALILTKTAIQIAEDVMGASEDDVITPEEMKKFKTDAKAVRAAYESLMKE